MQLIKILILFHTDFLPNVLQIAQLSHWMYLHQVTSLPGREL